MNLRSIYSFPSEFATKTLYMLLEERTQEQSISHRKMPEFADHCNFVWGRPYHVWEFIEDNGLVVGSIYLTERNEIGISIFKRYQGKGYGSGAVKKLIERYPDKRLLANINPKNEASIKMFEEIGFKLLQCTYELTTEE